MLAAALFREGADEDRRAAFGLWLAAAAGSAPAQRMAGYCYLNGIGCAVDVAAAVRWLQFAGEADDADALLLLGILHLEGRGVERDPTAAASLFERAAEQGHAAAQYNLGVSYGWGVGVERDRDLARRWLERAAGQKFAPAQPALTALGARRRAAPAMASASVDLDIDNVKPLARAEPREALAPGSAAPQLAATETASITTNDA